MSKDAAYFYTKVYFKSEQEFDRIKMRASLLGKKLSTHLRDLAITDAYFANIQPLLDTSDNIKKVQELMKSKDRSLEDISSMVYGGTEQPLRRTPPTEEEIANARKRDEEEQAEADRLLQQFKDEI